MSSNRANIDVLMAQLAGLGNVKARAMFGEYAIYCGDKVVALFCDDVLYVKNTDAGRRVSEVTELGSPYPGAKPHIIVPESSWEDRAWLCSLIAATASALPKTKSKKKLKEKKIRNG